MPTSPHIQSLKPANLHIKHRGSLGVSGVTLGFIEKVAFQQDHIQPERPIDLIFVVDAASNRMLARLVASILR